MADLIYPDGSPIPPARAPVQSRGRSVFAGYRNASFSDPDLQQWAPALFSPTAAYAPDRIPLASRIHDLARNDSWASAGVSKQVDAVIGSGWRLNATPNWKSLGITDDVADELAEEIEAHWKDYAYSSENYIDGQERLTFGGLMALAFRHRLIDGEALAYVGWDRRPNVPYATRVTIVSPDRLLNPFNGQDLWHRRMGVELGANGQPIGYHIRRVHPGDFAVYNPDNWLWDYYPRETPHGRRTFLHAFEPDMAGAVRGVSMFAPLVKKLKQLFRYDEAELQAALINALAAAVFETPFDQNQAAMMMGGGQELSDYQKERTDFYESSPIMMSHAKMLHTFPGDKLTFTKPQHPNAVFEHYTRAGLRNISSAMGITYEQLTGDLSQINYSSFRGGLIEVWRGFMVRREFLASQIAQPIYACWFEEAVNLGTFKLPKGAPDFYAAKAAWTSAEWIGPGRGWVDPLKEAEAAVVRMASGLSTLERETAEQGDDWRELMRQRAREKKRAIAEGINPDQIDLMAANVKGNVGDVGADKPVKSGNDPGPNDTAGGSKK